jgi:DNA-binding CsgD family transcriptional regulator
MAEGLANKEISSRLGISTHTVKFHISSILGKFNAASRTEAVSIGVKSGRLVI